ncbi:hypothetical protein [Crassaminicella profunda]|uniref:hypothetical protein n=1 Tax=Crassaminicella profunda TaxID=1286698 RepID=UPI001CA784E7|nr:hypothetical protein [Crassaminicella profunda]QZY56508.1 hypothetical protein K7H06_06180 [Crassaminicella profunda]
MKTLKTHILLLMILFIIFSAASCSKKPQKPSSKSENQPKPLPKVVEEIEQDALKIMNTADMLPYFQRVIVEQKKIEEKEKMEKMQMEIAKGDNQDQTKQEESSKDAQEKPKPKTIEESILTELLKKEKVASDENQTEKPPKDIAETWKKINTTIVGIHNKWNVLEPQLTEQNVSLDIISGFEETLDTLTKHGIEQNYFATMTAANNLTSYLPKFMPYFKKEIPPTVYTLKYLTRNIVLQAAIENYAMSQESLNQIKEQSQTIKSDLIEKKAKATADKFDASLINLEKSIEKKDIHLIKINASIVMKNIMLMIDDLSKPVS